MWRKATVHARGVLESQTESREQPSNCGNILLEKESCTGRLCYLLLLSYFVYGIKQ